MLNNYAGRNFHFPNKVGKQGEKTSPSSRAFMYLISNPIPSSQASRSRSLDLGPPIEPDKDPTPHRELAQYSTPPPPWCLLQKSVDASLAPACEHIPGLCMTCKLLKNIPAMLHRITYLYQQGWTDRSSGWDVGRKFDMVQCLMSLIDWLID